MILSNSVFVSVVRPGGEYHSQCKASPLILLSSALSSVGSLGGSVIRNAMHLLGEPTPVTQSARVAKLTGTVYRRVRAAMAVQAGDIAAADAIEASSLARD